MDWNLIQNLSDFEGVLAESTQNPKTFFGLFKHSTRCSISSMALNRIQRSIQDFDGISFYILDLLKHRDVSNAISEKLNVMHESPQVLIVKNGECVYHRSHNGINPLEIQDFIKNQTS
ncbi:MAG: bacillithiol system redox-active protein YtxJ [Flavobacteriales bacterium]|nr:bacillithiol system redox-active protein YtxJ [Flavobacteriales bacterium]